jgi:hypothetical protein
MKNTNLHSAKKSKNDEFYTQYKDIEKELSHYKDHFYGKSIYCNCDDPAHSNFWKYFVDNFYDLNLSKVVCTYLGEESYVTEYDGIGESRRRLMGDGDFRSSECVDLLREADIVVTNPPFSLFREYIAQLMEYDKKFLVVGHQNAITYKEIFPSIKENKIWLGHGFTGNAAHFIAPYYNDIALATDHREGMIRVSGVVWYTNINQNKHNEKLILSEYYYGNENAYPRYDNYDAIEVSHTKNIPVDYDAPMGVPITFLTKHNPLQFNIIDALNVPVIYGNRIYKRIIIIRK